MAGQTEWPTRKFRVGPYLIAVTLTVCFDDSSTLSAFP
jgi:hypothetical protein